MVHCVLVSLSLHALWVIPWVWYCDYCEYGSYPWKDGYVEVSVGGRVSVAARLSYDDLLSVPYVNESAISPSRSPSEGGLVTLFGLNFDGNSEVLFRDGSGLAVLPTVSCLSRSLTVSQWSIVGCMIAQSVR